MSQTPSENPIEATAEQVQRWLAEDQASGEATDWLIDCREPGEWSICQIEGATLIPMQQTPDQLENIQSRSGSRLVVYCHHGVRSLQVAHYLRNQGIVHAQSMAGGIDWWSQTIDTSVPRY